MEALIVELLSLISDVIEATIVIFGASIALYNLRQALRDRVSRAFTSLLIFIVIVYFTELIAVRAAFAVSTEVWLRLQWAGIALVPAAQFHLSDALLVTTGDVSRRRRLLVRVFYLSGLAVFLVALFTPLINVGLVTEISDIPHLRGGPFFGVFAAYFWLLTLLSIRNVWTARQRSLTTTTRQRMTTIALVFIAAPVSVFPYLITNNLLANYPILLWSLVIIGNLVVSVMFTILTLRVAYFSTSSSPDRVVRVRLYKFVARAPLTASITLLVYVLVSRSSNVLGLPVETALAIAVVATIIIVEGAIHVYKRPLERLFQLTDDPDVRRIQELTTRVLTTRELHEFLESLLASACNLLRTPTAFIATVGPEGPNVEVVVGPLEETDELWESDAWQQLHQRSRRENGNNGADGGPADKEEGTNSTELRLQTSGEFIIWNHYWIHPLYGIRHDDMLGIIGIRARDGESGREVPHLPPYERAVFARLLDQAEAVLEDRLLQQEVFAALEGALPSRRVQQQRRSTFSVPGAEAALTMEPDVAEVLEDPEFSTMVRDALKDYWGGPKLTESPLLRLQVVQEALEEYEGNPTKALRSILNRAIEMQKPEGDRSLTSAKWLLYNILEQKFVQGHRVRDVARRLAMSESDLYRKQRVAIENVARTIYALEHGVAQEAAQQEVNGNEDRGGENGEPVAPEATEQERETTSAE